MIGVSPAFFFSLYTTDFTVKDYSDGLEVLHELGLTGFQLEIFKKERLDEWERDWPLLLHKSEDLGLGTTQFVAHFLLSATADAEALNSDVGFEEMRRVTEIVSHFPACRTITLPLAPFTLGNETRMDASVYRKLWDRLVVKLLQFDEIVRTAGLRLGLEIVPGSLLGGTEGLMRLIRETGNGTIGYNFDTGHAWSSKECIATIPAKLAGRIYGTHLKDNFGTENLALPPGQGSIPWGSVIGGVLASGYEGSFDLEIVCKDPNEVKRSYAEGNRYMMEITKEALT
jgi:sugar phosphate isomerase/epimerase